MGAVTTGILFAALFLAAITIILFSTSYIIKWVFEWSAFLIELFSHTKNGRRSGK